MTPSISNDVLTKGDPVTGTIANTSSYIVWGDGIPIWWQSTDLAAFTASLQTTSSGPQTTSSASPRISSPYRSLATGTSSAGFTTSSAPSSSVVPGPSGGLLIGTKIAIGVVIPVAAVAIVL